jgi:acyl carrier protein
MIQNTHADLYHFGDSMENSIQYKIRNFIVENFLFGDDKGLENDTSFLEEGIIDSVGILELVEFIDNEFHITIADDELLPENLDSIKNISKFIGTKIHTEIAN